MEAAAIMAIALANGGVCSSYNYAFKYSTLRVHNNRHIWSFHIDYKKNI